MEHIKNILGAILYIMSNGRIVTSYASRKARQLRTEWSNHCNEIQHLLDEERERGWGFRYCDGRRIDF